MHNNHMQRGQALIVVLMVLAVVSAVGLSVASRSITEVNISTVQEESSRALSAAEAGIEAALSAASPLPIGVQVAVGDSSAPSSFTPDSITTAEARNTLELGSLRSGESQTVFLANSLDPNSPGFEGEFNHNHEFDICFGDPSAAKTQAPALEVTLYYYDGEYRAVRTGYDPLVARSNFNHAVVSPGSDCPSGTTYEYAVDNVRFSDLGMPVGGGNTPLLLRIKMLYNNSEDHWLGVGIRQDSGTPPFPGQGREIAVSGQSGSTTRRVQVIENYPDPAEIFDNALFAGGDSIQ